MAAPYPHFHHPGAHNGGPRHVCMMEGYDPELPHSTIRYQDLLDENKRYADEVSRLKALLAENNISIPVPASAITRRIRRSQRLCSKNGVLAIERNAEDLPQLPTEILLRILEYAVTSPTPLIDPFYKFRKENMTKEERASRKNININFLATNKAFNTDGKRLIAEKNTFVFTQAAALDNFAKIPKAIRAEIRHVTIRCVGRYYHDKVKKLDLTGDTIYHESQEEFTVPSLARPPGLLLDSGIQAYCWYQVGDFLKTLVLPLTRTTKVRPKLFPALKSLRMDLVNFCDHLPVGIWGFASTLRWYLGAICDELLITGIPELEGGSDEEIVLRNLIRDEGLISTGCPVFISEKSHLKALAGHGYSQQVVRANPETNKKLKVPSKVVRHPEGGFPPKSSHAANSTIWKWTSDHTTRPKTWIEFDRATGLPMDELDPQVDTSDDDDEDEEEDDENEDWDDEDDYDDNDMFPHMPGLATILGVPMGFTIGGPPFMGGVPFPPFMTGASGPGPGSDHEMDDDSDEEMPGLISIDAAEPGILPRENPNLTPNHEESDDGMPDLVAVDEAHDVD